MVHPAMHHPAKLIDELIAGLGADSAVDGELP